MRRLFVTGLLTLLLLAGCRGRQSEAPPIHPQLNMDFQEKFQPQTYNPLFEDKASMRTPPTGTVARGQLRDSVELYRGRTPNGEYVERVPIAVNRQVLQRGQDRYEVFCTPCHGKSGAGNGVIMRGDYGYTPASSYHVERLRQVTDGYLYDVITNGVRNMPPYAHQIPVRDRWAIVTYIRALQRSQNARPENLPESVVARIEEQTGTTIRSAGDTTATEPAEPTSD
jgi:mono/diheme cytochrome c family protein